jgi:hypothetical protein
MPIETFCCLQLPAKRACSADGHFTHITQTSFGRIRIPRIPPSGNHHGCLRRSEGTRYHPRSPLKKTVCGTCGTVHSGWYDRKVRRVRDLSCADTRMYLDIEVRRVQCRSGAVEKSGVRPPVRGGWSKRSRQRSSRNASTVGTPRRVLLSWYPGGGIPPLRQGPWTLSCA